MSLDDWILALHLLSAFALAGAMTMLWVAVLALRGSDTPAAAATVAPVVRTANVAVVVGILGTVVFGLWLAISLDAYHPWDGWVIAGLVLWAIGTETGRRGGAELDRAAARAVELERAGQSGPSAELAAAYRSGKGLALHAASSLAVVLVLLDMIWKPGA